MWFTFISTYLSCHRFYGSITSLGKHLDNFLTICPHQQYLPCVSEGKLFYLCSNLHPSNNMNWLNRNLFFVFFYHLIIYLGLAYVTSLIVWKDVDSKQLKTKLKSVRTLQKRAACHQCREKKNHQIVMEDIYKYVQQFILVFRTCVCFKTHIQKHTHLKKNWYQNILN